MLIRSHKHGKIRARLNGYLLANSFTRNIVVLASGSAFAQAVAVLIAPLLTRLYTPSVWGYFGLYTNFISVAQIVATLRLELAIVAAKDKREAAYLVLMALSLTVCVAIISIFVIYILIDRSWLGYGELPREVVLIFVPSLTLTPAFYVLRYWLLRENEITSISHASIYQSTVKTLSQLGLGLTGLGWSGLLIGDIAGRLAGVFRMTKVTLPGLKGQFQPVEKSYILATAKSYQKYSLYSLPSSFVNTLAIALPIPLIIHFYGAEAGGYFNLVATVFAAPLALIGTNVADAFHAQMAKYARSDVARCNPFFWRTARTLFFVTFLPTSLVMLFAPKLFTLAFGSNWESAGYIAISMAPLAAIQLIVIPLSRTVYVFQKFGRKLIYDIVSVTTPIIVLVIATRHELDVIDAITWLNVVNIATYVLYFIILAQCIREIRNGDPS